MEPNLLGFLWLDHLAKNCDSYADMLFLRFSQVVGAEISESIQDLNPLP
jgi:hypothetical protein